MDWTAVYPGKQSFALPGWDWGAEGAVAGPRQGEDCLQRDGSLCAGFLQQNEGKGFFLLWFTITYRLWKCCTWKVLENASSEVSAESWKSLKWFLSGFFLGGREGLLADCKIFLYEISPVLIASNPRTTESNWKMLLWFCQASDRVFHPKLGVSKHSVGNWVLYRQHTREGPWGWNLTPGLGPKTLCYTFLGKG